MRIGGVFNITPFIDPDADLLYILIITLIPQFPTRKHRYGIFEWNILNDKVFGLNTMKFVLINARISAKFLDVAESKKEVATVDIISA